MLISCVTQNTHMYSFFGKSEEQLSQKTVGQLLVNSQPTVGQQSADCGLPPFKKIGKSEEQLPQKTVGQLLVNSRPTVGRQYSDSRPTDFLGGSSSLLPIFQCISFSFAN